MAWALALALSRPGLLQKVEIKLVPDGCWAEPCQMEEDQRGLRGGG